MEYIYIYIYININYIFFLHSNSGNTNEIGWIAYACTTPPPVCHAPSTNYTQETPKLWKTPENTH